MCFPTNIIEEAALSKRIETKNKIIVITTIKNKLYSALDRAPICSIVLRLSDIKLLLLVVAFQQPPLKSRRRYNHLQIHSIIIIFFAPRTLKLWFVRSAHFHPHLTQKQLISQWKQMKDCAVEVCKEGTPKKLYSPAETQQPRRSDLSP